jgi:hypothetical protein
LEDGTLTISGEGEMPDGDLWGEYRSNIKTVDIKEGVTSIGRIAFEVCYNLTSITLPESVTSIGNYAFGSCRNLTSITIPDGVTSIERGVFGNCHSLTSISIPGVTSIGYHAFAGCVGLTSISIPNGVTSIGSGAFQDCWSLTSITIPNSVTSIENDAFSYCTSLSNVEVQWTKPLTISPTYHIFGYGNLNDVTLTVPTETKALYKVANVWKDFGKIIEKGDDNSNSPCDNPLASGTAGDLTWTFSCPDGTLTISGEGVMPDYDYERYSPWQAYHSSIKTVDIKEGVTSIGNWAFGGCLGLTSITIPNSVTSIGDWAFDRCISLPSIITIPHNVTNIGNNAFESCLRLTSIVIPNSVKSIGNRAFWGCRFLSNVEVQWANPLTIPDDVFVVVHDNDTLTVPPGTKSLYESAAGWKNFGTIIEKQQEITVDEEEPAGADGTGKIDLSLSIPTDVAFTGTFKVELPDGLHLDVNATKLAGDLGLTLGLTITQNADGSWLFTITSNALRSATETTYQKLVQIVYTVDESVADGSYEAIISDLELVFEDNTVIKKDEISVNVTVDHTIITGIANPSLAATVRIQDGTLFVNSAANEQISVYSVAGNLLYQAKKQAGETRFSIGNTKNNILIVKGSSGWVKKVY